MKSVKQMILEPQMTVGRLVDEMNECGVLGAGRLAKAVNIMVEVFKRPEYTTFFCMAGPMVPGGLREIIGLLIERGYVDAIVTSGANIVHDLMEALGYKGVRGSFEANDVKLGTEGIGRAGDIYFEQKGFEALERKVYEIFEALRLHKKSEIAFHQLLHAIGMSVEDDSSFLKRAATLGVPIFSPALIDSMLGLHIWTYSQLKTLRLNPILDVNLTADIIYKSERLGAIILGGGVPKHYVLGASTLREGIDAAIQITLDRPESGSLSGATLKEAISWKKAKAESKLATVIGDATIIFPIIVAAVFEKLSKE